MSKSQTLKCRLYVVEYIFNSAHGPISYIFLVCCYTYVNLICYISAVDNDMLSNKLLGQGMLSTSSWSQMSIHYLELYFFI
jgi:hypothetical protein